MKSKGLLQTFLTAAITLAFVFGDVDVSKMQTRGTNAAPVIADLTWMSGDWQTAEGGLSRVDEHWTRPAGGTMMGVSRTIVGDKTAEFEYLRIEQRGKDIVYVASPQGRSTTDFKLTRLSGQEAVFENPGHDFPKRIMYKKLSNGSLVATIDGGDKTKSLTFEYLPISK